MVFVGKTLSQRRIESGSKLETPRATKRASSSSSTTTTSTSYNREELAAELRRIQLERMKAGMGSAEASKFTQEEQAQIVQEVSKRPEPQIQNIPKLAGTPIVDSRTPAGTYLGKGAYAGSIAQIEAARRAEEEKVIRQEITSMGGRVDEEVKVSPKVTKITPGTIQTGITSKVSSADVIKSIESGKAPTGFSIFRTGLEQSFFKLESSVSEKIKKTGLFKSESQTKEIIESEKSVKKLESQLAGITGKGIKDRLKRQFIREQIKSEKLKQFTLGSEKEIREDISQKPIQTIGKAAGEGALFALGVGLVGKAASVLKVGKAVSKTPAISKIVKAGGKAVAPVLGGLYVGSTVMQATKAETPAQAGAIVGRSSIEAVSFVGGYEVVSGGSKLLARSASKAVETLGRPSSIVSKEFSVIEAEQATRKGITALEGKASRKIVSEVKPAVGKKQVFESTIREDIKGIESKGRLEQRSQARIIIKKGREVVSTGFSQAKTTVKVKTGEVSQRVKSVFQTTPKRGVILEEVSEGVKKTKNVLLATGKKIKVSAPVKGVETIGRRIITKEIKIKPTDIQPANLLEGKTAKITREEALSTKPTSAGFKIGKTTTITEIKTPEFEKKSFIRAELGQKVESGKIKEIVELKPEFELPKGRKKPTSQDVIRAIEGKGKPSKIIETKTETGRLKQVLEEKPKIETRKKVSEPKTTELTGQVETVIESKILSSAKRRGARIRKTLELNIPKRPPGIIITGKTPSISEASKIAPIIKPEEKTLTGGIKKPGLIEEPVIKPASIVEPRIVPRPAQIPRTIQQPSLDLPTPPPVTPIPFLLPTPGLPGVPRLIPPLKRTGLVTRGLGGLASQVSRQETGYKASFTAVLKDIRAAKMPDLITGVGLRPIVGKKKKKKGLVIA